MVLLVLVMVLLDSLLHSLVVELFEFQQLVHSQQFGHLVQSQQVLQSTHLQAYLDNCSCYVQSDGICYIFFYDLLCWFVCYPFSTPTLPTFFFSWVFLVRSSYVVDGCQGREFFPIRFHHWLERRWIDIFLHRWISWNRLVWSPQHWHWWNSLLQ